MQAYQQMEIDGCRDCSDGNGDGIPSTAQIPPTIPYHTITIPSLMVYHTISLPRVALLFSSRFRTFLSPTSDVVTPPLRMTASTNTDGHGITLHAKCYGAQAKVIHLIKRGLQLAPHLANNSDVFCAAHDVGVYILSTRSYLLRFADGSFHASSCGR